MEMEMEMEAFVFYSSPGMGHIFAMAELAKLIRRRVILLHPNRRLSFTLIYGTAPFEPSSTNAALSQFISSTPFISFLHLPHRPIDTSPTRSRPAIAFESFRNSAPDVSDSLRRISADGTKIRALIIDMFCSTALPIASDLGISVYHFFTSGSAALAAYLHMPTVHRKVEGRVFKESPDLMIEIPGLPAIPATEMPEPLLDSRDPAYSEMVYFCEMMRKSKGILVNTFDELEPVAMAAIVDGDCVPDGPTPPVYNIGPLILDSEDGHQSTSRPNWWRWATEETRNCSARPAVEDVIKPTARDIVMARLAATWKRSFPMFREQGAVHDSPDEGDIRGAREEWPKVHMGREKGNRRGQRERQRQALARGEDRQGLYRQGLGPASGDLEPRLCRRICDPLWLELGPRGSGSREAYGGMAIVRRAAPQPSCLSQKHGNGGSCEATRRRPIRECGRGGYAIDPGHGSQGQSRRHESKGCGRDCTSRLFHACT